jgi:hypothetical protein
LRRKFGLPNDQGIHKSRGSGPHGYVVPFLRVSFMEVCQCIEARLLDARQAFDDFRDI